MIKLKWYKLGDKKKAYLHNVAPKVFLLGTNHVQEERFIKFCKNQLEKDIELLIIGVLEEDSIPGLDGIQFQCMTSDKIKGYLKKIDSKLTDKIVLLTYHYKNSKYIIREFCPDEMYVFNGSWRHVIHYQSFWWEAYNYDLKIKRLSPFMHEEEARSYSDEIQEKNFAELDGKWRKKAGVRFVNSGKIKLMKQDRWSKENLVEFCIDLGKLSWDWTGQTGCVITKDNKVLGYGYNEVLPYDAKMMHEGAIREERHIPIGEQLEVGSTIHAELKAILNLNAAGKSLEGTDMWINKFHCPYCARVVASSSVNRIFYKDEYTNDLSYDIIKSSGKEVVKVNEAL